MSNQLYLSTILLLFAVAGSSIAQDRGDRPSAEERWNNLSPEKQLQITAKAEEKGFNMSTEEGRQAFFEAHRHHRHPWRRLIRELSPEERHALREDLRGLTPEERREYLRKRFGN